ncbi:hypothetical protein P154DRAFT_96595 [Amniculicola lignicola CBS 123094]|uniref:Uncharacterized protein n=1 Tax=Amniculicola lignicola CBS 123094 TaxID=1392246 RepID=A0A6A5VWD0_9PLEO|nr:hypothetical protein P154DRAFT_96595 [Amniculicola lignicola CBS 123094]
MALEMHAGGRAHRLIALNLAVRKSGGISDLTTGRLAYPRLWIAHKRTPWGPVAANNPSIEPCPHIPDHHPLLFLFDLLSALHAAWVMQRHAPMCQQQAPAGARARALYAVTVVPCLFISVSASPSNTMSLDTRCWISPPQHCTSTSLTLGLPH